MTASDVDEESHQPRTKVQYLKNGALRGFFDPFSLPDARDSIGILPYASHPSMITKIKLAIFTPSNCVLLRTEGWIRDGEQTVNVWILAHEVPPPTNHSLLRTHAEKLSVLELSEGIFLRWVGCVICRAPRYSSSSLGTTCLFGLDVDEQGVPLRIISPSV